jgi:hypothetical protein
MWPRTEWCCPEDVYTWYYVNPYKALYEDGYFFADDVCDGACSNEEGCIDDPPEFPELALER